MIIYLMQHGEAVAEAEDPARPLTAEGRSCVGQVAARAAAAGVCFDMVVHSRKLRSEQTAGILAEAVGATDRVQPRTGLSPKDPVRPVADWLRGVPGETNGQVAVVGHLPSLNRLASLLVAGDEQAQIVVFRMGGLVRLVPKQDRDGYSVDWVLTPELAGP